MPMQGEDAMENDRLLKFRAVAEMYRGISEKTVRRKIAARELPQPVYVGRTPDAFLVGSNRSN
jgi:predicted DNA-binding transcriptional regulator AlpA